MRLENYNTVGISIIYAEIAQSDLHIFCVWRKIEE